jgi:hypothetical protein
MKFNLITNYADASQNEKPWKEFYEKNISDPEKWGKSIIESFNATLRPHERLRVFLGIEILGDKDNSELHEWEKMTSGMSVQFRGRHCDIMLCKKCGITGKRYGLSSAIKIDSKYRKKIYRKCNTSKQG